MKPHQFRVLTEKEELDDKRLKLHAFFSTKIFSELDDKEKIRLSLQYKHMTSYSEILGERIAAF